MIESTSTPPPPPAEAASGGGWPMSRIVKLVAGGLIGIVVIIFLIGLALALFTDAQQTAPRIQIIRDIFIIILTFLLGFIVLALSVLVLQVARLINLLRNEVLPILHNTQDTLTTARGTVEFVGTNLTQPIIRASGFMAGTNVLLRELFGLRRALRKEDRSNGRHTE